MIASLTGEVISIGLDHAVISCNGVGYKVIASPATLGQLTRGEEAHVITEMVVREDAMHLYGFLDPAGKDMFILLQTVSGLGPKLALAALSVMGPAELAVALASSDHKGLQRIPGVGKRMAERMVVELKGKTEAFAPGGEPDSTGSSTTPLPVSSAAADQVTEALVGLGFPEKSAGTAVSEILAENPEIDSSQLLRMSLTRLGQRK